MEGRREEEAYTGGAGGALLGKNVCRPPEEKNAPSSLNMIVSLTVFFGVCGNEDEEVSLVSLSYYSLIGPQWEYATTGGRRGKECFPSFGGLEKRNIWLHICLIFLDGFRGIIHIFLVTSANKFRG